MGMAMPPVVVQIPDNAAIEVFKLFHRLGFAFDPHYFAKSDDPHSRRAILLVQ